MRFPLKITSNFLLEPVMHMFGARSETSYAEVSDGTLEVQMGAWFHEKLPLTGVTSVAPSNWPWWGGLGVKLAHHGVGVVGDNENIVNIRWKDPLKVRVLIEVSCSQIWLSVEDPQGFLKAVSQAAGVPISEHTPF